MFWGVLGKRVVLGWYLMVSLEGVWVGGTPLRHGHKESYTDLNLKNSTSEWDSNPRPHEYLV